MFVVSVFATAGLPVFLTPSRTRIIIMQSLNWPKIYYNITAGLICWSYLSLVCLIKMTDSLVNWTQWPISQFKRQLSTYTETFPGFFLWSCSTSPQSFMICSFHFFQNLWQTNKQFQFHCVSDHLGGGMIFKQEVSVQHFPCNLCSRSTKEDQLQHCLLDKSHTLNPTPGWKLISSAWSYSFWQLTCLWPVDSWSQSSRRPRSLLPLLKDSGS